jgi:hypothetical protein
MLAEALNGTVRFNVPVLRHFNRILRLGYFIPL